MNKKRMGLHLGGGGSCTFAVSYWVCVNETLRHNRNFSAILQPSKVGNHMVMILIHTIH